MCLAIFFAPFLLEISQDGKAHAMGFLGGSGGNNHSDGSDGSGVITSKPKVNPTPEPGTLLLFGAGAAGLAVLRKKFKKR